MKDNYVRCSICGTVRNIKEAPKCPVCFYQKDNIIKSFMAKLTPEKKFKIIKKVIELSKKRDNLLTLREIKILETRLGLDNGKKKTLQETGEVFGLTRERIRQIEMKAIEKCLNFKQVLEVVEKLLDK